MTDSSMDIFSNEAPLSPHRSLQETIISLQRGANLAAMVSDSDLTKLSTSGHYDLKKPRRVTKSTTTGSIFRTNASSSLAHLPTAMDLALIKAEASARTLPKKRNSYCYIGATKKKRTIQSEHRSSSNKKLQLASFREDSPMRSSCSLFCEIDSPSKKGSTSKILGVELDTCSLGDETNSAFMNNIFSTPKQQIPKGYKGGDSPPAPPSRLELPLRQSLRIEQEQRMYTKNQLSGTFGRCVSTEDAEGDDQKHQGNTPNKPDGLKASISLLAGEPSKEWDLFLSNFLDSSPQVQST
jgi:hypothetical protein